MKSSILLHFATLIVFLPTLAEACPTSIENLRTKYLGGATPCEVSDRYAAVTEKLKAVGIESTRVADILAPRFIQGDHWKQVREAHAFSPWTVYSPAPQTWGSWENGRKEVEDLASKNMVSTLPAKLSVETILAIHRETMAGTGIVGGTLRTSEDVGMGLTHEWASPRDGVKKMKKANPYFAEPSHERIITWNPRHCVEDLSAEFKAAHPYKSPMEIVDLPEMMKVTHFVDAKGIERECGYFTYAPSRDVSNLVRAWGDDINSKFEKAYSSPDSSIDPLEVTARAQKWFVAIHPFRDGNGRMSRFVMDYLVESMGLPAPVLPDMDNDLTSTEQEWAANIGAGVLGTLETLEACANAPTTPGCNAVSRTP